MSSKRAKMGAAVLASIICASCGLPSMMAASRRHKLFRAVEAGDVKQVEQLLDRGLNVDTSGFYSDRALRRAAAYGQCQVMKVLLERGAKTDDSIAELALRDAIAGNHACAVELLLDGGVSADSNFYLGGTPLMSATGNEDAEVVDLLLQHGADPNLMGRYEGWVKLERCSATALMLAAKHGNLQTVDLLLAAGAHAGYRDEFGCSARDVAEYGGHTGIVATLDRATR